MDVDSLTPAKRAREEVPNDTPAPKRQKIETTDMDFSFLDEVDDEPSKRASAFGDKYTKPDVPPPIHQNQPAATEAPSAVVVAPPERQIAIRTPEQQEVADRVTAVALSDIVQALEKNHMDNRQAAQCRKVLGWAPPDLQDKRVQQYMVSRGRYPHLAPAFENEMLGAFLTGINRASRTISCGLMLAHISRNLLKECIEKTGANSTSRKQLVDLSRAIRVQIDNLADRVNEFVKAMAQTNKEMGAIAYLVKYGATVDMLTNKLKETTLKVSGRIEEMDVVAEQALVPVGEAADYVQSKISSDETLAQKKRAVEELRVAWNERAEKLREWYDKREQDLGEGQSSLATTEETLKMVQRQVNARGRELERLDARAEQYNARIGRLEQMKEDILNDRGNEMAQNAALKQESQAAVAEEVKEQQRAIDSQLSRLEDLASQYSKDESDCKSKSMTASDGRERVTTTTTRYRRGWSWLFWWGPSRTTRTSTSYIQRGGNEKQRLENMAGSARKERKEVEKEIERLRAERANVVVRVKQKLTETNEQLLRQSDKLTRSRHADRAKDVQQQIVFIKGLKAVVVEQQQNNTEQLQTLEAKLGQLKGEFTNAKRRVETWENHPDNGALDRAKKEEEKAMREYHAAQEELKSLVENFGIRSEEDYATFMKLFRLLNDSLSNLPSAMRLLSKAFDAAYVGFNGDFFRGDFQLLPEKGQQACLLDATRGMQAIAMVGTDFIDAPVQNMIAHQGGDLITRVIESGVGRNTIEAPENREGPRIEEVDD